MVNFGNEKDAIKELKFFDEKAFIRIPIYITEN